MSKKLVLLLAIAGLLSGCSFNVKLPPLTTTSASEGVDVSELIEIAVTQSNSAAFQDDAISELTYPKFSLASGDAEIGDKVVGVLNTNMQSAVNDFQERAVDSYLSDAPEQKSSLWIEVRKAFTDAALLKFDILNCEYIAGAAHGNCFGESFIFDATTAERLSLWDEISPAEESAFLDYVTSEIFQQLDADLLFSRSDVREFLAAESFINWWVYDGAITVTFAPYAIAPYASGEQEIYLELEQIESFLKQTSQLPQLFS